MKFDLTYATHEAHKCSDYLSQAQHHLTRARKVDGEEKALREKMEEEKEALRTKQAEEEVRECGREGGRDGGRDGVRDGVRERRRE